MDNKTLTTALMNTLDGNILDFKQNIEQVVSDKLKTKVATAIQSAEKKVFSNL